MPSDRERFVLYVGSDADWRWSLIHENGNEVGGSTEGYANRGDAIDNAESILGLDKGALDFLREDAGKEYDDWIER